MNRTTVLAATSLAAALVVGIPSAAEAHTARFSADCDGVVVNATAYDANAANRWTVTIAGVTQTGTFGASFTRTFSVPQAGATTAWSASIDAAGTRYDFAQSGTVGPCGEAPPPPPVVPPTPAPPTPLAPPVKHAKTRVTVVDRCNCYRDKVTMHGGDHVRIRSEHPTNTLWVFTVTGRDGYLLPSTIGGNHGWAATQVYKVRTKNQTCPCVKRGDCHELYPGYTPPANHCRPGREHC